MKSTRRRQIHTVHNGNSNRKGIKRAMLLLKAGANLTDVLGHYLVFEQRNPRKRHAR